MMYCNPIINSFVFTLVKASPITGCYQLIFDIVKKKKKMDTTKTKLSKSKMVYARETDPEDTVVVKSLWPDEKTGARFGVKGKEAIKVLFETLIVLIHHKLEKIISSKYVQPNVLEKLAEIGKQYTSKYVIRQHIDENLNKIVYYIDFQSSGNRIVRSVLSFGVKHVMFSLKLFDREEEVNNMSAFEETDLHYYCGISLFPAETIRLLCYLNSRFDIVMGEPLITLNNRTAHLIGSGDSFF